MLEVGWEDLDEVFNALEAECANIIRGLTVQIFYDTLRMSPQYFGRFASSWTYSINNPEFRSDDTFNYDPESQGSAPIYRKGDYPAISVAIDYSRGRDIAFKLGDTVYISNGADHGSGPYGEGIEDGTIPLRSVNQPGRPMGRAVDIATSWFGNDMSPEQGEVMKALRLSDVL